MSKKKHPDQDLQKIASKTISRGMSLLQLTVSGGAKYAGLKIGAMFRSEEEKDEKFRDFLTNQAQVIADELGKLKGSIMKAGQLLSVYGEHFLPPQVNNVLKTLQSDSKPVSWNVMKKVLIQQLGEETFLSLSIDEKPIGAASMGQVYKGLCKKTNQPLAIKVQYPGVDKAIDSDLKTLKTILSMTNLVPFTDSFEDIFKEIRMMLHQEADYTKEFETILEYKEKLKDDPRFIVPHVFQEYSTKRVLTMSFEDGVRVDSDEVSKIDQNRRNKIGIAVLDLMFKEIYEWKMVQTDPHIGNYKIRLKHEENDIDKVILYDFGAVRKFPKRYIEPFARMVNASLDQNKERCIKAGRELGFLRPEDSDHILDLFTKICFLAVEGFEEKYESPSIDGSEYGDHTYDWGQTDLMKRLSVLAKDAVFAFKLRPPPREAIFLDRKMVGTYSFGTILRLKFGPRKLIKSYVTSFEKMPPLTEEKNYE